MKLGWFTHEIQHSGIQELSELSCKHMWLAIKVIIYSMTWLRKTHLLPICIFILVVTFQETWDSITHYGQNMSPFIRKSIIITLTKYKRTCKFGLLADKRPVSVLIFNEQWIRPLLPDILLPWGRKKPISSASSHIVS